MRLFSKQENPLTIFRRNLSEIYCNTSDSTKFCTVPEHTVCYSDTKLYACCNVYTNKLKCACVFARAVRVLSTSPLLHLSLVSFGTVNCIFSLHSQHYNCK